MNRRGWRGLAGLALAGLAALAGSLGGCTGRQGAGQATTGQATAELPYPYRESTQRSVVSFSGQLAAASSTNLSLRQGAWGLISWMKEEGQPIASGELAAVIDMSQSEDQLIFSVSSLRAARHSLREHALDTPRTLAESQSEVESKARLLAQRRQELAWLRAGPTPDQVWKAVTAVDTAAQAGSFSRQVLEGQRRVTERGFDSPFTLRSRELDARAREVEWSYNRQLLDRLLAGPKPEELAKGAFQVEVAAGEAALARNQLESASASRQVDAKGLEFEIEVRGAELRETNDRLDQRRLLAPTAGLVIHPMMWGEKFARGREVWEDVPFMKIVATSGFEVDCSVDEPVSALLKTGATATVRLDAFPDRALPGRLTFIGKSPRQQIFRRRSQFKKFPVTVAVDVGSLPVRLGLKARITVVATEATGVFLPRDVVGGTEASPTVRIPGLLGGASPRPVQVVPFDSDLVRWLDPPASEGTVLYP
ncbi:MAG: HlyD family efflux transporter periplasmic adaptor subunit [Candidatus Riflebacteria bacterium]|nr:HlyD family efflux transporter periplasmic adaptor subunit [Candidatus Riflebacteria bacterium]